MMKQMKDLEFGQQWEKTNRSANTVLTVLVLAWSLVYLTALILTS